MMVASDGVNVSLVSHDRKMSCESSGMAAPRALAS